MTGGTAVPLSYVFRTSFEVKYPAVAPDAVRKDPHKRSRSVILVSHTLSVA